MNTEQEATLPCLCGTEFKLSKDSDCADPGAGVQLSPAQPSSYGDRGAVYIKCCKSTFALSFKCIGSSAHTCHAAKSLFALS